jgi:hypothetical protein
MKKKNTKQTKITKQTKAIKHFVCFVIFVCFVFSLQFPDTHSQSLGPQSLNGRWNLTIEDDLRRSEILADLRIENSGTARLVILSPTGGEDGLFTGGIAGDRLQFKGRYDQSIVEIDLTATGGRISGKMAGDRLRVGIQGQRASASSPEVSRGQYSKVFEAVWNGVGMYFYDPRLNGADLAGIRQRHLPRVKTARNDGELAVAIRRSLSELKSSHTEFSLSTSHQTTKLKVDRVLWKELSPNVGYLALHDFNADDLRDFDAALDRAMDEAVRRPGLVLDLRGNMGVNLEAALAALNFILPEGRSIAYFATREGLTRLGVASIDQIDPASLPAAFVDNQIGVSKFQGAGMYLAGGKYKRPFRGRIALLIDENCLGSCEWFAAAMKEAGVASLIGRRTRGAALFPSPVTFSFAVFMPALKSDVKGWRLDLPMMDLRTAGKMKIDGRGVEPDIVVERAGVGDADLARALQWLDERNR